ncbi:hypothetical protein [Aequorivita sp. CIP111184]|uniref:hypothetical protein n=1 Tax=Aequorivita sp. CIP111184 TaxID=2211356 RepID=UPI000DBC0C19|nr:hypothetical protein [Aequorivita sp. CIP111184]SRX55403.1 hypothetical protein AEQU1_02425 [Aequorivita sp. CIP111184]
MKRILVLLPLFILTIACGNSEKSNSEESLIDNIVPASSKVAEQSPCELLSESEIKDALSIPADTETTVKEKNITYPSCFYKWESITWPYEVMKGHMADYTAEMSIVLVTGMNKKNYETAVSYYKDGKVIKDVGDMARWDEKKTQITFLYKGYLIHVHTKTSADAASNKVKTIKVAKLIVGIL